MGHMSIRGRVMGHMDDGNRGDGGTWAMGHIVDVLNEFSEYIH